MRNVWFFGDSTTYGHGLRPGFEYYDNFTEIRGQRWTKILAEYFDGNPINFASCGASNEDIKFRLTTQLNKINSNDVVVIQPTYPTRINIFTNDGEYKPIHMAFGEDSLLDGRVSKDQIKSLKLFTKHFLIDNTEKFDIRDMIYFQSLKLELEKRNVSVIIWHHEVMNSEVCKHMGWKTIEEESGGKCKDYHLGWESQKLFANFIIEQYENKNTFINPHPDFYVDITKLRFDFHEPLKIMEDLFKFVGRRDLCKDYDENYLK